MTVRGRSIAYLACLVWLCWLALPSAACSLQAVRLFDIVEHNASADGVVEYQHISWTPFLGFRGARSVSVVTRYWGRAPVHTGLEIHRSPIVSFGCGSGSGRLGTFEYSIVESEPPHRSILLIVSEGDPSPEQVAFDRFGPPVELPVPLTTRAAAWGLVLWQPILIIAALVATIRWALKRRTKRTTAARVG